MSNSPIRVFVVDDHLIFRESLIAVIGLQKDMQAVGHAGSVAEAKPLIAKSQPDIVLLDLRLSAQNGLDLLREVPNLHPTAKVIAVTGAEAEDEGVDAIRSGARGYLVKQTSTELFLKCIRKVHAGEIWLNGKMTEAVISAFGSQQPGSKIDGKNELSRREMEVIELVIQGYKNKDIAQKLFISEKTVKNHLSAIFNKLGVTDRLELTLYVFERRLFSPTTES